MEKKVELAYLMAFYGGLLTDKQRNTLSMHCEEDMSLSEIAQETGVSRTGVYDLLQRTADKLFSFEEKLQLAARFQTMQDGLMACRACLAAGDHEQALKMLDALIQKNQEDDYGL